MIVREVDPDHAEAAAVYRAAFAPLDSVYRPVGKAAAHQHERAREGTRLIAVVDDRTVGTVQYAVHRHHVHLIGLAVHPSYQRRGVARRLVAEIAARAPGLGHHTLAADTIRETGNVTVLERLGFVVVREQVADWCVSDRHDALHQVDVERKIP